MTTTTIPDDATLAETITITRDFIEGVHVGTGWLYDLVLRDGVECRSVPWRTWRGRGYGRAPGGECFKNAELLAVRFPDLIYVEGFASTGVLPVHHAWCATSDGRVVDPTWRPRAGMPPVEEWEYLGVPLHTEWVEAVTLRRGWYSVFGEGPVDLDGAIRSIR